MPPRPARISPILQLIVATTVIRIAFAATTGLGVDESYMVTAGRVLSLGYFDHPPASWWLSWGSAHLFGTEAPWAVRLPFILLFALSQYLVWLTPFAALGASSRLRKAALALTVYLVLCFIPSTQILLAQHGLDPMGGSVGQAIEHIQATPSLPRFEGDVSVFFALQDWRYGCPNAVLKALAPDDATNIDAVVPAERHLTLVRPAD